jgi:hypothetical protein
VGALKSFMGGGAAGAVRPGGAPPAGFRAVSPKYLRLLIHFGFSVDR